MCLFLRSDRSDPLLQPPMLERHSGCRRTASLPAVHAGPHLARQFGLCGFRLGRSLETPKRSADHSLGRSDCPKHVFNVKQMRGRRIRSKTRQEKCAASTAECVTCWGPVKVKMQAGRGTAGRHSLGVLPRTDGLCRRKSSIAEHLLTLKDGKRAFSAVLHSAQLTRYRGTRNKISPLLSGIQRPNRPHIRI